MARKLIFRSPSPPNNNQDNNNSSSAPDSTPPPPPPPPPTIILNPEQKQQLLNYVYPNPDEIDEAFYEYYHSPNFGDFLLNDEDQVNPHQVEPPPPSLESQLPSDGLGPNPFATSSLINSDDYSVSLYQEDVLNLSSISSNTGADVNDQFGADVENYVEEQLQEHGEQYSEGINGDDYDEISIDPESNWGLNDSEESL